ncbi:MAG: glycosyl hydrolase family 18 protein [Solirubrobacterales bacterium]
MNARPLRHAALAGATLLIVLGAPPAIALGASSPATALGAPPVRAAHAAGTPAPGPGGVQAFILPTAPDSLTDLRAHAAEVSVVYPTYFECEPGGGAIEGHDEPALDAAIAALAIPMLPRFTCQDGATVDLLLREPRLRARTLDQLLALARNPAYAGLSLDLENAPGEDRAPFSSFVAALARGLHLMHRKLTVVVDGVPREEPRRQTYLYDDNAIAAAADNVFVLAWGVHWAGSAPGPIAPLPWVRRVVAHILSLPHARRFVLGVPMYGLDWGTTAKATARQFAEVSALAHSVGAQTLRDRSADELTFAYDGPGGTPHRVWYLDGRSIRDRLALAHSAGLAAGVWRLGREDQTLWASPFIA